MMKMGVPLPSVVAVVVPVIPFPLLPHLVLLSIPSFSVFLKPKILSSFISKFQTNIGKVEKKEEA